MNLSQNPNMNLWNSVCITDPKKVKPIKGKSYQGSSPQPYWLVQRATETFGPCGIGWGIEIIEQGFQQCNAETILHYATVRVWYIQDDKRGSTEHMGGTMAMYKSNTGKMIYDEDAPKKSVTDAIVKALSFIGFAGDIFSGIWDDWKYQEFANEHHNGNQSQTNPQPLKNSNKNQVQTQQKTATKPKRSMNEAYNDALKAIPNAPDTTILNVAMKHFKGTTFEAGILKACQAKCDLEGWSTYQLQQINQLKN